MGLTKEMFSSKIQTHIRPSLCPLGSAAECLSGNAAGGLECVALLSARNHHKAAPQVIEGE